MNRTASKLVTGRHYSEGEPRPITGYLTQCPSLNGLGGDRLVPVTLLTAEGEKVRNVLVRVIDVAGVKLRNFSLFSDHMLWRVAEINMGGLAEGALAELAYRESQKLAEQEREESARLALSRRSADALMGRV